MTAIYTCVARLYLVHRVSSVCHKVTAQTVKVNSSQDSRQKKNLHKLRT